jgi:hypothetical protein
VAQLFSLGAYTLDFMTSINLAIVGLRLLAVYCFVQAIPLFSAFGLVAAMFASDSFRGSIFTSLLPGGSLLILAVVLFIFSEPLARRIASSPSADAREVACTFEQLQALAFAVAGILILATSLPSLGRAVQDLFVLYSYHKQGGTNSADRVFSSWLYSAGVFAQLVVGVLLLLKPKGFRNVWRYLQTAGT